MSIFTPSGAGEIELYSFNFAPLLAAGVTYRLYANAATSTGQNLTLWSRVYCPTI